MSMVIGLMARLKLWLPLLGRPGKPEPYVTDWKDYYQALRVDPEADSATIAAAHRRLMHVYRVLLSSRSQHTEFFTQQISDTEEAYQVLSDKGRRAAYNKILKQGSEVHTNPGDAEMDRLVALISMQMAKGKVRSWLYLRWIQAVGRAALIATIVVVLVTSAGTSLALARPESTAAAPFRGIAGAIAGTSMGAISLIEEVRAVAASYESSIVSQSVQAMRLLEGVKVVPAVGAPTNDMASFPSKEHSLFPEYLDRRFSQFKYTVDSRGIVRIDTSGATTDALLAKIKDLLRRLEAE